MYKAVVRFADRQDDMRIYEVGETFPRFGFSVSEARIKELAGSNNRMGYPLIVAEKPVEAAQAEPAQSIKDEAKPAKKPRTSRKKG